MVFFESIIKFLFIYLDD